MFQFMKGMKVEIVIVALTLSAFAVACKDSSGPAVDVSPTTPGTGTGTGAGHGPAVVSLGSAADYVILAKSGISSVPNSVITGDIGVSPAAATTITGFSLVLLANSAFSTSAQVTGSVFAPGYAVPTPNNLTVAVLAMEAAYTDAAGRTLPDHLNLGSGNIGGLTLPAGLYRWSSAVTVPTNVTLNGGANDVWIMQISGGLTMASDKRVTLTGGALASNVFWQVAGAVTVGTGAHIEGQVLGQTGIVMRTGSSANGRLLAQTAVTLATTTVVKH